MPDHGYRIDHIAIGDRCCDLHNIHCEPPGDLCCQLCPERDHHQGHRCVLDRCTCDSEAEHLGATQPSSGSAIGTREPTERENVVMHKTHTALTALKTLRISEIRRALRWIQRDLGMSRTEADTTWDPQRFDPVRRPPNMG